jgi:hypothetical protein
MSDDRFEWEGTPAGQAPAPLTPPRRSGRVAWLGAGVLSAAVAAVVVVLLTSGNSTPSLAANTIARAASVTSGTAGYRFSLTMAASAAGQAVSVQANGSANERPQQELSMTMASGGESIQAIEAAPWEYVAVNGAWYKINRDVVQQTIGDGGLSPAGSDPSQLLQFLGATGTVTTVGAAQIGGVATTHYHAATELDRYADTVPSSERQAASAAIAALERETGVATLPIDVWIDAQHRVRQIVVSMSGICPQAGNASVTITMDLFDYGPQPAPAVPSDATDLTSEAQSAVRGQSSIPAQASGPSACG